MGETGKDVVAVARPDHLAPFDRASVFLKGLNVGHDLTGMRAVGQPVDHRNGGIFRHLQQGLLFESADHDHIDIARQHAGGVGDGLTMAELHIGARKHHGLPTHLPHAHVERDTRPGRGFLKDQRDHVILQRLVIIRRAARAAIARGFHGGGIVDDLPQIGGVGLVDIEEMVHLSSLSCGVQGHGLESPRNVLG